jgi:trimeric autotransporter adhesin
MLAGGSRGYSGDGGPAIRGQLVDPLGLAVDSAGNLYIADGNRVRRLSSEGIITTVAGNGEAGFSGDGGPAIAARLGLPVGVAVDSGGSLYISERVILGFEESHRTASSPRLPAQASQGTPGTVGPLLGRSLTTHMVSRRIGQETCTSPIATITPSEGLD